MAKGSNKNTSTKGKITQFKKGATPPAKKTANRRPATGLGKGVTTTTTKPKVGTTTGVKKTVYTQAEINKSNAQKDTPVSIVGSSISKNKAVVNTNWGKIICEFKPEAIQTALPPLPMHLFQEATAFFEWCCRVNKAEGALHYTLLNGEWIRVCYHQTFQGGGDVNIEFDSAENEALVTDEIKAAFKKVHCTIHSHNDFGAFQSGTDEKDEQDKSGWHITIGDLNKEKKSFHSRFTLNNPVDTDEEGYITAPAMNAFLKVETSSLLEQIKIEGYEGMAKQITEYAMHDHSKGFPEEWKARHTEDRTTYVGFTGGRFGATNQCLPGYGGMHQTDVWDDEDWEEYYQGRAKEEEEGIIDQSDDIIPVAERYSLEGHDVETIQKEINKVFAKSKGLDTAVLSCVNLILESLKANVFIGKLDPNQIETDADIIYDLTKDLNKTKERFIKHVDDFEEEEISKLIKYNKGIQKKDDFIQSLWIDLVIELKCKVAKI